MKHFKHTIIASAVLALLAACGGSGPSSDGAVSEAPTTAPTATQSETANAQPESPSATTIPVATPSNTTIPPVVATTIPDVQTSAASPVHIQDEPSSTVATTTEPAVEGQGTASTSATAASPQATTFSAIVAAAPDDGAYLCNFGYNVQVQGNGLQRVEMTSNDGILVAGDTRPPKTVNQLAVAPDGTSAQLAFNVRNANANASGQRDVVVTAYSATGESAVVMSRTWTFDVWAWRDRPHLCTA